MKFTVAVRTILAPFALNAATILLYAASAGANIFKSQAYIDSQCAKSIEYLERNNDLRGSHIFSNCVSRPKAPDFRTAKKVVVNVQHNLFLFKDKEPHKRTISVRGGKIYHGFNVVTVREYVQGWRDSIR